MSSNIECTVGDLKAVMIFDAGLSKEELATIKFQMYLDKGDGVVQKARELCDGNVFLEWLHLYNIDPHSGMAAQIEMGIPITVPEGTVRFVRIEPK